MVHSNLVIADAHVHIHPCFDLDDLLDGAVKNFSLRANQGVDLEGYQFVLLLTETSTDKVFRQLCNQAKNNTHLHQNESNWQIYLTREDCSVYARNTDGREIYIIAGSQIVVAENLEVLALGTADKIPDGQPLTTVVEKVIDHGGIPVIPWGFGKWLGKRGKILSNFLSKNDISQLFLGDNSARPIFWFQPTFFQTAKKLGLRILPGTDPLPFPSEASRAGSFGFTLEGNLNPQKPAESLKQLLRQSSTQPQAYGSLENPWRFIRNQIAMQLVKRQRTTA